MRIVLVIWMMLVAMSVDAQQYRVRYEPTALPELYTTVKVFGAKRVGTVFNKLSNQKYKLVAKDGKLDKNHNFTFDRAMVYANKGMVNFTMMVDDTEVDCPMELPILKEIRYNLYTDSIKPVLNYYVNVEGEFTSSKIYPLNTDLITITADHGEMRGLEWILPKERNFDKVTFTTRNNFDPSMVKEITIYLKKQADPRDADNYQDRTEEEIIKGNKRRK